MNRSRHRWVLARPLRLAVIVTLLLAFAATAVGTTPARADIASPWGGCASVKVVGIRGTAEDFSDSTLGMGPELYPLYQQVAQGLPGLQIAGTGLWYPAAQWTSPQFTMSIGVGAADLGMDMEVEAQACPQEKVVLIGYSQGAAVLGDYLDGISSTALAPNILAAAVLWADPNFNQLSRTAIPQSDGLFVWHGVLGPRDNTPDQRDYPWIWGNRIASYCLQADPVCNWQGGINLSGLPVHFSQYAEPPNLGESASAILALVKASNPVYSNPPPYPPAYPPTPGPGSPPPPPKTGLFDYNPVTGASFVDLPTGTGNWLGIRGPAFSTGWNIYTGDFTTP